MDIIRRIIRGMKKKILAGLGVLVGIVVLSGVFGGSKPQVAGTQIEVSPTPTIVATPIPTVTPTPSLSPTPIPTLTPKPTVKATPKPTIAPTPVQVEAPCGTYVNSVGQTVPSPCEYDSAPAGATAICGDGTYSFSQSRRGTCSHHGGVSQWL